jgi:hypothetical protein
MNMPPIKVMKQLSAKIFALWFALSTCLPFVSAQEGTATDLDNELAKFANRTIAFLTDQEQDKVTVGSITGTGKGSIPGGPGIAVRLTKALEQVKPNITSDTAVWTIEGRMLFGDPKRVKTNPLEANNASTKDLSLTIFFTLINQSTQAKIEDQVVITKLTQTPFFVATTFETSPQADIKESRKDFVDSLTKAPFIDPQQPSHIRARATSPYALELRTKSIGAETEMAIPVKATIETRPGIIAMQIQPFAIAPIAKNQEYEIAVYNDSAEEIAVAITVDGIDVFSFSQDVNLETKKSLYTHFVIAPKSNFVLPGWHQTVDSNRDDNFLAFLVTEYGKGARSSLFPQQAADGTVGAVTVAISKTVPPGGAKSARAETAFGRPVKKDQKPVVRIIEPPHAFISVRYDR